MSNRTANYTSERVELIKERLRRFNASKLAVPSSQTPAANQQQYTQQRESKSTSENKSANQVNEVKPKAKQSSPVIAKFATLSSSSHAQNMQQKSAYWQSPNVKVQQNYYKNANGRTSTKSRASHTQKSQYRQDTSMKDTIEVNSYSGDNNNNNEDIFSSAFNTKDNIDKNNNNGNQNRSNCQSQLSANNVEDNNERVSRKSVADSLRAFMRAVAQVQNTTQHHSHKETKRRTGHTDNMSDTNSYINETNRKDNNTNSTSQDKPTNRHIQQQYWDYTNQSQVGRKQNTLFTNGSNAQQKRTQREEHQGQHWQQKWKTTAGNLQNQSFDKMTQQQIRQRQQQTQYYQQQIKNAQNILKQLRQMSYQTEQNKQQSEHANVSTPRNKESTESKADIHGSKVDDEHQAANADKLFSNFMRANKGKVKLQHNKDQTHQSTLDTECKQNGALPTREQQHLAYNEQSNTHVKGNNQNRHHHTSSNASRNSSASTSSLLSSNAFTSNGPFSDFTSLNSQSLSTLTSSQSSSHSSHSLQQMLPMNAEKKVTRTTAKRRRTKVSQASSSSSSSSSSSCPSSQLTHSSSSSSALLPSTARLSTSISSTMLPTQQQQNNQLQKQVQANTNPSRQSKSLSLQLQQQQLLLNHQNMLQHKGSAIQQRKQLEYKKRNQLQTQNAQINEEIRQASKQNTNVIMQQKYAQSFNALVQKLTQLTQSSCTECTDNNSTDYNSSNNNKADNYNNNNGNCNRANAEQSAQQVLTQYFTLFNQLEVAEMNIAHAHKSVQRFTRAMHTKSVARSLPREEQIQSLLSHRQELLKQEATLRNESAPNGMTLPQIQQIHCQPFQQCLRALSLLYANISLKLKTILARRDAVQAKRVLWQQRQGDLHERQKASNIIEHEIQQMQSQLSSRRNALRDRQKSYQLRLREHSDRDESIQRHIDGVEQLGGTISTWLHILQDRDVQLRRKEEKLARVRADLDRRIEDIQICKNVAKKYRQHSLSSPLSSSSSP